MTDDCRPLDDYLAGLLADADAERFEHHAAGCPTCDAALSAAALSAPLAEALGALGREACPPEVLDRVVAHEAWPAALERRAPRDGRRGVPARRAGRRAARRAARGRPAGPPVPPLRRRLPHVCLRLPRRTGGPGRQRGAVARHAGAQPGAGGGGGAHDAPRRAPISYPPAEPPADTVQPDAAVPGGADPSAAAPSAGPPSPPPSARPVPAGATPTPREGAAPPEPRRSPAALDPSAADAPADAVALAAPSDPDPAAPTPQQVAEARADLALAFALIDRAQTRARATVRDEAGPLSATIDHTLPF